MDIEALVKKHGDDYRHRRIIGVYHVKDAIRAALIEQATEHKSDMAFMKDNSDRIQQEMIAGLNTANERIRQLEAEKAEYERRIIAVGGVAINSVSREYHDAEVARLNAMYEMAVKGRQDFRDSYRGQLEKERVRPEWDDSRADGIVSSLYRRFKEWSKQGFGPEDVTWCEVKAEINSLLSMREAERVPEGHVCVPAEMIERFPEINQHNYNHDDVCELNAWGIELYLAAAPAQEKV